MEYASEFDILNVKADLVPELADCVYDRNGILYLSHKLVMQVPYFPQCNAYLNAQFDQKQRSVSAAIERSDWNKFIWLHEKPYRVEALYEIAHRLSDRAYWKLLGAVWVNIENVYQYGGLLRRMLTDARRNLSLRPLLMDREERSSLRSLPDTIVVYRGCGPQNKAGLSWTLDQSKARWFAGRLKRRGDRCFVLKRSIGKHRVLAYFSGRSESEIVVAPAALRGKASVESDWAVE